MKWVWVMAVVISGVLGDVLSAKGMSKRGEIHDFRPRGIVRILQYIGTHRTVLAGIGCNALAFMAFLALLSAAQLSFAVPATALSYIVKTALAQIYLREAVTRNRWIGAILVAIGIVLISF